MRTMNPTLESLSVRGMIVLGALVDNNFHSGKAAEDLGISQPCFSVALKRLAVMEGYNIFTFTKGGGKVTGLTHQGRILYAAMKPIIDFVWTPIICSGGE